MPAALAELTPWQWCLLPVAAILLLGMVFGVVAAVLAVLRSTLYRDDNFNDSPRLRRYAWQLLPWVGSGIGALGASEASSGDDGWGSDWSGGFDGGDGIGD